MAGFGISSDPLSLSDTEVEINSYTENPEGAEALCRDSQGDNIESTVHGEFTPIEVGYKICRTGNFDTTLKLGQVAGSYVVTGITINRSNQDMTTATVTAIPKAIVGDTATLQTYTGTWPTNFGTGIKGALGAGFTKSAGRIISSSVAFTVQTYMTKDSLGAVKCVGLYGGRMDGTNELQSCDTQTAGTAAANWTLAAGSGSITESNEDYQTGTFTTFRNYQQD